MENAAKKENNAITLNIIPGWQKKQTAVREFWVRRR